MKGTVLLITVLSASTGVGLIEARGGLRTSGRKLQASDNYKEIYFSELMLEGETVVVLDEGPFKFTASCKTVTYDYSYYYYSSYQSMSSDSPYYNSSMSSGSYGSSYSPSSSSGHYFPYSSGGSSSWCSNPCSSSSSPFPPGFTSSDSPCSSSHYTNDTTSTTTATMFTNLSTSIGMDPMSTYPYRCSSTSSSSSSGSPYMPYSDDYMSDYTYTESFAGLELTYTARDVDYLYGSPSYSSYPDEVVLVGGYEAGESRTQTVFAGRDGGWGDDSTLASLSGYYVTINGDRTIGIHRDWAGNAPDRSASFPEGIDCMMSGFITYVEPGP